MQRNTAQLFPELIRGASLNWFAFQYPDGTPYGRIGLDPKEATTARSEGRPVRLWPKDERGMWSLLPSIVQS